jgi:hypothetical protein
VALVALCWSWEEQLQHHQPQQLNAVGVTDAVWHLRAVGWLLLLVVHWSQQQHVPTPADFAAQHLPLRQTQTIHRAQ